MSRRNPNSEENMEFFVPLLEGFADQYEIELQIFNNGLHWRLSDDFVTLDVWPTSGRFYIKDLPIGRTLNIGERKGDLDREYNNITDWLYNLFDIKLEDRL